jgi:hypothetical protein
LGQAGARLNTISSGIIITPLANDELKGLEDQGTLNQCHPYSKNIAHFLEVNAIAAITASAPDGCGKTVSKPHLFGISGITD